MTGPEKVEVTVANVKAKFGDDEDTRVKELLEVIDFLHGEYRFMNHAFLVATNGKEYQ